MSAVGMVRAADAAKAQALEHYTGMAAVAVEDAKQRAKWLRRVEAMQHDDVWITDHVQVELAFYVDADGVHVEAVKVGQSWERADAVLRDTVINCARAHLELVLAEDARQ